jgi:hypothetical protein
MPATDCGVAELGDASSGLIGFNLRDSPGTRQDHTVPNQQL